MENKIKIELTKDVALVLFEWLARTDDSDGFTFDDAGEQHAVWHLQACFEELLVEPFKPEYDELVSQARTRLREKYGETIKPR